MKKEVISVEIDQEFNTTSVELRVPEFDNFGQKLKELEEKTYDAIIDDPDHEEKMEEALEGVTKMYEASQEQLVAKIEALPDGAEKDALKAVQENIEKMNEMLADEDDLEDADDEIGEEEDEFDVERIDVELPEGVAWDESMEGTIDAFLRSWPDVRGKVLEAVFDFYKSYYDEAKEFFGDEPETKFVLPEPKSPTSIEDNFIVSTVYVRADGAIGLSGHCTWDEEHAWGVRLKDGEVTAAGQADEAFA